MNKNIGRWTIGTLILGLASLAWAQEGDLSPALNFEPLPYAYDALEPYIDAQTLEIHYGRHHQAYFNNLVKAVAGTDFEGQPLETLFSKISQLPTAVRNHGGGHWNHAFYWKSMAPNAGGMPDGDLMAAIERDFGSLDEFKKQFEASATGQFGSGWAWLVAGDGGGLFIVSTPNQDNPLMDVVERRGTPLLNLDVWEHAYYLKYQNKRADFAGAFWTVVNWPEVAARFAAATQK